MMAAMQPNRPAFMDGLRGQLLMNEPMSRHTSWRVGGKAEYFYTPADKADLVKMLKQLPVSVPVYWVGLGSNLLVRDGGVDGMIVRTARGLSEIEYIEPNIIRAQAGVSSAKIARVSANNGLTGVEFLAGVPGSFGGALAMNAGAFGGETWPWVLEVECVDRWGVLHVFSSQEIDYRYRAADIPPDHWITEGKLKLNFAPEGWLGKEKIRSLLDKRSASQPIQSANAGSVFQNPKGGFAAEFIEKAGWKGKKIGGAEVSMTHANFIINTGEANASNIIELIEGIQQNVLDQFNVQLTTEVRVIGVPA
ncbi:MAG: UDP-N-acetylmuramate dehydrogenase [Gammaproteobacteria bacterium]|nr:UDP-N-acetylmuramate dehydrogenase [Gammaproteobacteria bacterium]